MAISLRDRRRRSEQCIYLETLKDYDRQILRASRVSGNEREWMMLMDERRAYVETNRHRGFCV
jgi:hypothetical protein